ncbi:MAG: 16S rRNA processing protein RimM, partial [Bacteroidota bacterium]
KGELRLVIEEQFWPSLEAVKVVFLEINGRQVPYFVERLRLEYDAFIKFEEIDSKEAARQLASKKLFLKASDIQLVELESDLQFAQFEGFTLFDETLGKIGEIQRVEAFSQQEIAFVDHQGKEVMIPMNEQLISKTEQTTQEVWMQLPEGLLDL